MDLGDIAGGKEVDRNEDIADQIVNQEVQNEEPAIGVSEGSKSILQLNQGNKVEPHKFSVDLESNKASQDKMNRNLELKIIYASQGARSLKDVDAGDPYL
ncbi:hypothetical protein ACH5RR_039054 [Cinchona calisaya]|uniref:Uncharacterized protein n=1 Tax=Cinchona calisaya TaxID=153742 RepID=A0ABD2XZL6_9GENT